MITTTTCVAPSISISFNPNLLSTPIHRNDAEYLFKIGNYLLLKIVKRKFKKFNSRVEKLLKQHEEFMELYGRAKAKEREIEGQKYIKARMPFYRCELPNRNDQAIFERLEQKRRASKRDRESHAIQKIRGV